MFFRRRGSRGDVFESFSPEVPGRQRQFARAQVRTPHGRPMFGEFATIDFRGMLLLSNSVSTKLRWIKYDLPLVGCSNLSVCSLQPKFNGNHKETRWPLSAAKAAVPSRCVRTQVSHSSLYLPSRRWFRIRRPSENFYTSSDYN